MVLRTVRERLALWLAPWLGGLTREWRVLQAAERDIYARALVEIQFTEPIASRAHDIATRARIDGQRQYRDARPPVK